MDDMVSLFLAGQREFSTRLAEVDGRWHAPTPDDEWDVGALVDHLIDENRWAAPLLAGKSLADAGAVVEAMGSPEADRVAAWEKAAFSASEAFSAAGALERTVELSRGPTPARQYLAEMIFDLCIHAWDLGKAVQSSRDFDPDLVDSVYAVAKDMGDLSGSGYFKSPVDVPDDAPALDRLVGLTGRDPAWQA
jgi:uncharacterized protein (TIGR03086 family)